MNSATAAYSVLGLFILWALAVVAIWVRLNGRLITCLRSRHNELWVNMGRPNLFRAVVIWGSGWRYSFQINYPGWINAKAYLTIHDEEVTTVADQINRARWLIPLSSLAVVAIAFGLAYVSR
jgi:hypothetical protein